MIDILPFILDFDPRILKRLSFGMIWHIIRNLETRFLARLVIFLSEKKIGSYGRKWQRSTKVRPGGGGGGGGGGGRGAVACDRLTSVKQTKILEILCELMYIVNEIPSHSKCADWLVWVSFVKAVIFCTTRVLLFGVIDLVRPSDLAVTNDS